jgi:5'-methylthioadenosine phosphorylase
MLGIIGGTGFYKLDGLEILGAEDIDTPFGAPSAPFTRARFGAHELFFLPRHGAHHEFLPHEINYRANVYALKTLGVRQVISISAVGSLRAEIAPGDFAIPTQYIDWIKDGRKKSFFENGLPAHVAMGRPVCPNLAGALAATAQKLNLKIHTDKTYVCVDGPRFGTSAESHMLRGFGADLVGMTNVPEVFLMREAQIAYTSLCIATDYDAWQDDPELHADTAAIIARYGACLDQAQNLLRTFLGSTLPEPSALARTSLNGALMTDPDTLSPQAKEIWATLTT